MGVLVKTRDEIRVAVIGYGYWGSKHVRVLCGLRGVSVTVIDASADRIADAKASFPMVEVRRSLDEVMDEIDAVVVATPPATHASIALKALRAGKHALVEKPLATSSKEAAAMVRAAALTGVRLMVGHTFEYNAAVWKLKDIIDSGELGRIHYIDAARLGLGRYQRDCNVIWDLAPHDISIVSYLLGETPYRTAVWAQRYVGSHHADVAYLRMDFEEADAHAFVHVSWLDPRKVRRITVVGERKMVVYNDMSDNERIRVYDIGVDPVEPDNGEQFAMPVSYRTGDIVSPFVQFNEPLLVQANHFIDCVRNGTRPNTPGERGLEIVRVLEATDMAEASGVAVSIAAHDTNSMSDTSGPPDTSNRPRSAWGRQKRLVATVYVLAPVQVNDPESSLVAPFEGSVTLRSRTTS
jgi:predicted dehydrogenase